MNNNFNIAEEQKIIQTFTEFAIGVDPEDFDEREFLDNKMLKLLFSLYQFNHYNIDFKEPISEEMVEIISNIYELRKNNKRDDNEINAYLAIFLSLIMVFIAGKEKLSQDFTEGLQEIVNIQLYLYNTENEDGNKTEYEDLSSIEKLYTDNLMNRIREIKTIQADNKENKTMELFKILMQELPDVIDRGFVFVGLIIEDYLDTILEEDSQEFFNLIDIETNNSKKQEEIVVFLNTIVDNLVPKQD